MRHRFKSHVIRLLERAALVGDPIDLAMLAVVANKRRSQIERTLATSAEAQGLVVRDPEAGWRFVDAAARDGLISAIPAPRRASLHRDIAERLAAARATTRDAVAIAHHYGEAGEFAHVRAYLQIAGFHAIDAGAYDVAARHLRAALEAGSPDADERSVLWERLADVAHASRGAIGSEEWFLREALRACVDEPERRAALYLRLAGIFERREEAAKGLAYIELAYGALDRRVAYDLRREIDARDAALRFALDRPALARDGRMATQKPAGHDVRFEVHRILELGHRAWRDGLPSAAHDFDRARELVSRASEPDLITLAGMTAALAHLDVGTLDAAEIAGRQALAVARQIDRDLAADAALVVARIAFERGDSATARTHLSQPARALDVLRLELELALLDADDERLAAALPDDDAFTLAFAAAEPGRAARASAAAAAAHFALGRRAQARRLLARALAVEPLGAREHELYLAVARVGAPRDFPAARGRLAPIVRDETSFLGAQLALFDAIVSHRNGRGDESRRHARSAEAAFEALGRPLRAAEAARLARRVQSAAPSRIAHDRAYDVEHDVPSGFAGLTPRQAEIAQLVAVGYRNREIAEMLEIAEHTVERHLHDILRRLDLRSRFELVDLRERE